MNEAINRTCFVIIGYGDKIDLASQRHLNMDRVFENVIKPAFDSFEKPKFKCFRACDENFGGIIDAQMYKWIYEADFVVADISTLNPNAIYELGIRHALRPYTTLVIAEDGIKDLPFDVNHVKIEKYKHLGEDVGVAEAKRFIGVLRSKIQQMLDNQSCDSPVYTYIQKLKPPYTEDGVEKFVKEESAGVPAPKPVAAPAPKQPGSEISLTQLLKQADQELKDRNFSKALGLYKEAEKRDKTNASIKHHIILATYKSEEPDKETALITALGLLKKNFVLKTSIDTRTIELSATINKKLGELEYEKGEKGNYEKGLSYLYSAMAAYEKAFVLTDSFFTGGNYANVLLLGAAMVSDLQLKYQLYARSIVMWQRVYDDAHKFHSRNSLEKTIQARLVLDNGMESSETVELEKKLEKVQTDYHRKTYQERLKKSLEYASVVRKSLEAAREDIARKMIL